jgi:hypothetical protein
MKRPKFSDYSKGVKGKLNISLTFLTWVMTYSLKEFLVILIVALIGYIVVTTKTCNVSRQGVSYERDINIINK